MKIAAGSVVMESNSFSPLKTDIDYFSKNGYYLTGDRIIDHHRNVENELAGFIQRAAEDEVETTPVCAAWAVPHGPVTGEAYREIKETILSGIRSAEPVDGVYLALHGSMVVEDIDDSEGDLLESVRRQIGERPLVTSLDFHANVTRKMARSADLLVGYNSFPHDNLFQTGEKAAELMIGNRDRLRALPTLFVKIPLLAPLERMSIVEGEPLLEIMQRLDEIEELPGVIAASFFGVHPWLDIPEMGSSIVAVVEPEAVESVSARLAELATAFWEMKETFFDFRLYTPSEAIKRALDSDDRPILLNESSDNVGAGATGDSAHLIRALLEAGTQQPSLTTVVDPPAVGRAITAGVGNRTTVRVGGSINDRDNPPVELSGRVRTIFDGRYRYQGPVYHGVQTSMGRTVVIEAVAGLSVQITELPAYTIDPEHYRCTGLFPERSKLVHIKSQGSFKASYTPISTAVFYLDTPGVSSSNLRTLPYSKIDSGKLYPFNQKLRFEPEVERFGA